MAQQEHTCALNRLWMCRTEDWKVPAVSEVPKGATPFLRQVLRGSLQGNRVKGSSTRAGQLF